MMKKTASELLIVLLCAFMLLGQCCFSNEKIAERVCRMPDSILREIDQAAQAGSFSCDKRTLFSRDFFQLPGWRLLLLIGIPDYLCASNSFIPVIVDEQGNWQSGPVMPGAPSWVVLGPGNDLWLAAQWQVEGTFPALYRSLDGVDWQEVTLPENRGVDCCFERLERVCFPPGSVRLEFAGDEAGKTARWEADADGFAGSGPVWRPVAGAREGGGETPCPFVPLGPGAWTREEAERSAEIVFKKSGMHARIAVIVPGSLAGLNGEK